MLTDTELASILRGDPAPEYRQQVERDMLEESFSRCRYLEARFDLMAWQVVLMLWPPRGPHYED